MSVMLNLSPEVQQELAERARARGISFSEYLQEIIQREAAGEAAEVVPGTAEERAKAYLEWAESFPDTPPVSDEAISRASLYPDRW